MTIRSPRIAWVSAAVIAVVSLWPALGAVWCPRMASAEPTAPAGCCCHGGDQSSSECSESIRSDARADADVPCRDSCGVLPGCQRSCGCPIDPQFPTFGRTDRAPTPVVKAVFDRPRLELIMPQFAVEPAARPVRLTPRVPPARSRLCVWVI